MIPKSGYRFSEKIMLQQSFVSARCRDRSRTAARRASGWKFGSVARTARGSGMAVSANAITFGAMPRQGNRAGDRIRRRQGIGRGMVSRIRRRRRRDRWRVRENAGRRCGGRCLHRIRSRSRRCRRCGGRCRSKCGDLDIRRGSIAGAVAHPIAPRVIRCSGVGRCWCGLRRCGRWS